MSVYLRARLSSRGFLELYDPGNDFLLREEIKKESNYYSSSRKSS